MSDGAPARADPDEVFGAVANETRFSILRAVWDLTKVSEREAAASFAAIREEAGVRDSGQFNYHLQELQPRFVRKTDDGYRTTHAGSRLVGAVVSGVYTDDETAVEPRQVGECPNCGGTVQAGYGEGRMDIECVDCEVTISDMAAPPILAASHDPDDLPAVFTRHLLTEIERLNRGFCPYCSGRLDVSVERTDEADEPLAGHLDVEHECRACGGSLHSVVGAAVVDHPAVISLYHDAGVDLRETPIWDLDSLFDAPGDVVGEDPLRIELTLEVDGRTLELVLDEELNVLEYERRRTDDESA